VAPSIERLSGSGAGSQDSAVVALRGVGQERLITFGGDDRGILLYLFIIWRWNVDQHHQPVKEVG
jgi:hypothetical protein